MARHCPNPDCPGLARDGVIPEFVDTVADCLDCGSRLIPGVAFPEPPPPVEFEDLRTVLLATNLVQAHLVRGLLEAAGIRVHLKGEHQTTAVGELPADALRVEVQVALGDEDDAVQIVRGFESRS